MAWEHCSLIKVTLCLGQSVALTLFNSGMSPGFRAAASNPEYFSFSLNPGSLKLRAVADATSLYTRCSQKAS